MTFDARLVFSHDVFIPLSRLEELISTAAAQQGLTAIAHRETLAGVALKCTRCTLSLDLEMYEGETLLALSLAPGEEMPPAEAQRMLAAMTLLLLQNLDAEEVIWLDAEIRLARDAFFAAFKRAQTNSVTVTPRRAPKSPTMNRQRPVAPRRVTRATKRNHRTQAHRFDAHVRAYDAHLREMLRREPCEAEIEELRRITTGRPRGDIRASAWAMSFAVAMISLPLAAPVVVHNIVKGEDMRFASLAMGLAGLFAALDGTGAVADMLTTI